jgi:hypothetical protein
MKPLMACLCGARRQARMNTYEVLAAKDRKERTTVTERIWSLASGPRSPFSVPRSLPSFLCLLVLSLCPFLPCSAATFTNNACVTAKDSGEDLIWSGTTRALTVSCWCRISIPSSTTISSDMTILVNRQDGDENSPFSYLLRFNASNGNVEFLTRGASDGFTSKRIERPYLERWYHLAVKRAGNTVAGFVDGREVFNEEVSAVGNSSTCSQGISIGGVQATQFLQRALSLSATSAWLNIYTAAPPTPVSGSYTDSLDTNAIQFYRVKAVR